MTKSDPVSKGNFKAPCILALPEITFILKRSHFRRISHAISRAAACGRSAQLLGTSEGRERAKHHHDAWILARAHARDPAISKAKFCDGRRNFSKISVEFRMQSHAPQHADARHSCWGPLRVVYKLRTTSRHGFLRDFP